MFNPGVLVESSGRDWLAYLEGQGVDTDAGVAAVDPSNFNAPSIAVGSLVGTQTVTRRITSARSGTFKVTSKVSGFRTKVSPSSLRFSRARQTKTVRLTFTRTNAPLDAAAFGTVQLKSSRATAKLPVALTPRLVAAPEEAAGTGTTGSTTIPVTAATSGAFRVSAQGLVAPQADAGRVSAKGEPQTYPVTVTAGTPVARFAVDAEAVADVYLGVYRRVADGLALVGASETASGDEQVTLTEPEPGEYLLAVFPYADPVGATGTAYTARSWVVDGAQGLTVSPTVQQVTGSKPFAVTASWRGLAAGQPYLGADDGDDAVTGQLLHQALPAHVRGAAWLRASRTWAGSSTPTARGRC